MSDDKLQQVFEIGADLTVFVNELEAEREAIFENVLDIEPREAAVRLAEIDGQIVSAKFLKRLHHAKKTEYVSRYKAAQAL